MTAATTGEAGIYRFKNTRIDSKLDSGVIR